MIIVAGHIDVPPEGADRAADLARSMMEETRREDGCVVYDITRSLERPGRFHVYEEWRDLAALAAHGDTAHMGAFRKGLAEITVIARDVRRREAGEASPL